MVRRDNDLPLNVEETKEVAIDFRRVPTPKPPLTYAERGSSIKFLEVHISEDLSRTSITKSQDQAPPLLPP